MKFRIAWGCASLLGFAVPGVAEEPLREQFAYALPLQVDASAAVNRLELPLSVYRDTVDPRLADLRVLNGRGEVVPFALQRPADAVRQAAAPVPLQLFPLRGDPAAVAAAVNLSVRDGATQLEIQGAAPADEPGPPAYYLVHAGADSSAFEALTFAWAADTADFAVNVLLETSEDLVAWNVVVPFAPLARLRHGADVFEHQRMSFPATRARFWRLRPLAGETLPEITGVTATPVAGTSEVERLRAAASGQAVPGKPGEYVFDLEAQLPVDRIELELPDSNTVARVELFARRSESEPWRPVTHAVVYRLNNNKGAIPELISPPVSVPAEPSRYWRMVVDPGGGGIGQGLPAMRVGWLPHTLLFVLRGAGPFELVYGGYGMPAAEVALTSLLPVATLGADGAAALPRASAGEPGTAGGAERLLPPPPVTPWRLWLLWIALLGGVLTLAFVAWRLARQMRSPAPNP